MTWASITTLLTLSVVGSPVTTPFLYHHRRHSHASRILSPKVVSLRFRVFLAALNTRSHSVTIARQDSRLNAKYFISQTAGPVQKGGDVPVQSKGSGPEEG
jgi:hypothetical protein